MILKRMKNKNLIPANKIILRYKIQIKLLNKLIKIVPLIIIDYMNNKKFYTKY